MLAEDNEDVVRSIVDCLSKKEDIELVAVETDGQSAVNAALLTRPDVLVLDLILSKWDGFAVMQQLRNHQLVDTRIIVLSGLNSDFMIKRALQHGACYYMVKPFLPELLYENIVLNSRRDPDSAPPPSTPIDEDAALSAMLSDVLGLSARTKGTGYLKSATLIARGCASLNGRITKEIYPTVADLYDVSPVQVERAIRNAIEHAWTFGSMRECGLFPGINRPTNGEVIAALAMRKLPGRRI